MMNTPARSVPKKADDRRVVRTRQALGSALVELMLARRFDDISVQQVLDRARVGRATFYAHFRNKQDLLLSDAERFFEFWSGTFWRTRAIRAGWRRWPSCSATWRTTTSFSARWSSPACGSPSTTC
jgi:AcrR family transcriptional regulator